MLKLAALGALGYAGYKYYRKNMSGGQNRRNARPAVAGGPISDRATVQANPTVPPRT